MMNSFVALVRRRLNTGVLFRALLRALIIAAVVTVFIGLYYIFRGHAVDSYVVYPIGFLLALMITLFFWFTQRKSEIQSAVFADKYFHLKDSLTSSLEFASEKKQGAAYELQKKQTLSAIETLSPKSIPLPFSKKLCYYAIFSILAAGSLALVPPSEAVLKAIEEKKQTQQRTEEIQQSLKQEVEEMISSLSDEEKEAVDPDAIRQWVKELKAVDEKREALRNIARVEQKIQKKIDELQNRKNEELLKAAGVKMLKAQNANAKELGKSLKNKHFKKAAKQLEKFKIGKDKKALEKDLKLSDADKKRKKLSEKQKQLAKLKEVTKRLSQSKSGGNASGGNGGSLSSKEFGEALEDAGIELDLENLKLEDLKKLPEELLEKIPAELLKKLPEGALNQLPPELLEKLLELMQQQAGDLQEMMDGMELEMMQGEQMGEDEWNEFLEMLEEMDGDMEALQRMLERLEAMKLMRGRLNGLKQSLGMAQGYANGSSQFQGGGGKGGKKPGIGSSLDRREQKDKLENNKQYSKLKGQKGKGPVKSTIEEADSGTGHSKRGGKVKQRKFEHQMSSFIERDDVSEEMKQGVKQYFEDIHKTAK